jgi:hypothetical protein
MAVSNIDAARIIQNVIRATPHDLKGIPVGWATMMTLV